MLHQVINPESFTQKSVTLVLGLDLLDAQIKEGIYAIIFKAFNYHHNVFGDQQCRSGETWNYVQ